MLQRVARSPRSCSSGWRGVDRFRRLHGARVGHLSQGPSTVLEAAEAEAGKLKDEYVSTEHSCWRSIDRGDPAEKR